MTEESNALDYLERAHEFLLEARRKPMAWKWVATALHGAVYGFAIAALRGSNPDRVTYNRKGKRHLISFREAVNRCQDPRWMKMTIFSKPLILTSSQQESLRKLSDVLRNEFVHYVPKDWSIELSGMPKIACDALDVVKFLALETGNYVRLKQSQQKRLRALISKSRRVALEVTRSTTN